MKPLVSILIPAFNAHAWLKDTIQSALSQTWPYTEIIIVDDGSRDDTLSIARQFASNKVAILTQPNQGAAAARNKAYSLAQGDYIQWLDADDLLAPNKIACQIEVLGKNRSKRMLLSGPHGTFFYRVRKARFRPSPLWSDLSPTEWLLRKMSQNCHLQTATWLVSREITDAAGPWDTRLLGDDDGEYFCRAKLASDGIRFVREAKVYYRDVSSNRLSYIGTSDRKMEAQWLSMQLHIKYLRSIEDTVRTKSACVKYLQNYMFDFSPERPDIVRQMEKLAVSLGGQLEPPRAPWKYYWIQKIFGWGAAKCAQFLLPAVKTSALRYCDKIMHGIEQTARRRGNRNCVNENRL